MSKQTEALKLALEALEYVKCPEGLLPDFDATIKAGREALAEQPAQQEFECPRCGHCCPEQQQQEPVAMYEDWYDSNSCSHCGMVGGHANTCRYYKPAQRKPLTDERIKLLGRIYANKDGVDFARAIEAAHGIKE